MSFLISRFACSTFCILCLHHSLIVGKHLNVVVENVQKSKTGALKDSWQSEPVLTF